MHISVLSIITEESDYKCVIRKISTSLELIKTAMFLPYIIGTLSSVKVTPIFLYVQGKETNKDTLKLPELITAVGDQAEL